MTQEALDFGRAHRVAMADRKLIRTLADSVDAIGLLQASGACDARKSELNDALQQRDARYVRSGWILAILDASPLDFKKAILNSIAEWQGFSLNPARPKTAEEKLAELQQRVAMRFGVAGVELVEETER